MKTPFRLLAVLIIASGLALRVFAQGGSLESNGGSLVPQNEEDLRYSLYKRFLDVYKTDEEVAYEIATQYCNKFPQDSEQTRYLMRWVTDFNARKSRMRKETVRRLIDEANFNHAFALGKEILKSEPTDVGTMINLVDAALGALSYRNQGLVAEATTYAKTALKLMESGYGPKENRRKIVAWLNRSLGIFCLVYQPAEATRYFSAALEFYEFKNDAHTYAFLADSILESEYRPIQREYADFHTIEQKLSPEGQRVRAKLNRVADRIIDAFARAVRLSDSDPSVLQEKTEV